MSSGVGAAAEPDLFDVRRTAAATGLLGPFNEAGVLVAADVHVARRLSALGGEENESVLLAIALAVRAPRQGHVCVDLATIAERAAVDVEEAVDLSALPWPEPAAWLQRVAASGLVGVGESEVAGEVAPLRLVDSTLYLDRYWREERQVATDLRALAAADPAVEVSLEHLADGLARLFPGETDSRQRLAAAAAVLRPLAVVAGGPGTGKTTTVARIVALVAEQARAADEPAPLVALAAPTGKAAARLQEAVVAQAALVDVDEEVRAQLLALEATTLHRLLGWRPDSHSRFRHHRGNRLPYDLIVVDETSMVSLSLMARLVEAVRAGARLVLVGDPGQLASVEAGAVLGDVVGPAADGLRMRPAVRDALAEVTGHAVVADDPPEGVAIGDGIVVLDRVYRFGEGVAAVAEAIRRADADALLVALRGAREEVTWIESDAAEAGADLLAPVRDGVLESARAVVAAARAGSAGEAIDALTAFRLLCAHRRGPFGVAAWTTRIEGWLAEAIHGYAAEGRWYAGRPLLMTENDQGLRLSNGDTGVVIRTPAGALSAVFRRGAAVAAFAPSRLRAVDTVHAMTIHKSQGSQFGTATVLLPPPTSPLLTRELLYTAVTRARERLVVVGTEEALCAAVARPVGRASGLGWRLWNMSRSRTRSNRGDPATASRA